MAIMKNNLGLYFWHLLLPHITQHHQAPTQKQAGGGAEPLAHSPCLLLYTICLLLSCQKGRITLYSHLLLHTTAFERRRRSCVVVVNPVAKQHAGAFQNIFQGGDALTQSMAGWWLRGVALCGA